MNFILKWKLTIILVFIFLLSFFVFIFLLLRAPVGFPLNTIYTVEKGVGLNSLALDLANNNIIKSPFLFKVFSVLTGGTRGVIAGDYALDSRQNTLSLANRISHGEFGLKPVKITFREGLNVFEISTLSAIKFIKVDPDHFKDIASPYEGYLFPDTYLFLPNARAEDIITEMKSNFFDRIKTLDKEISNFDKPLPDIIKMASIVEEEARTFESKQIIAGILWKRLSIGMPLQVDASFKYINGKVTKNLTLQDLKIDSPYNTYVYKGLPPTPIANPGLVSIKATVTPIKTDYLYFLTDRKGVMHYAKTYSEHLANKKKYLP